MRCEVTAGTHNTAIGYDAGVVTAGAHNAAIGYASSVVTTGTHNTAVGYDAGWVTAGTHNAAIGYGTLGRSNKSHFSWNGQYLPFGFVFTVTTRATTLTGITR